jgi:hypothetical protein
MYSFLHPINENTTDLQPMVSRSMTNSFGHTNNPISSNQMNLKGNSFNGGYRVIFKKGSKRITIYRFILAKIVHDPDGLGIEDLLALFELNVYLDRKSQTDEQFHEKYHLWLNTIDTFIEKLSQFKVFPIRLGQIDKLNLEKALVPFLPSSRAYFGYKKQPRIYDSYRILLRNPLKAPKKLPSKRYIGVGYRDKGSLKNTAIDGSPHWKEVAADSYEKDRRKEEINNAIRNIDEFPLKESFIYQDLE